ncbi:MAG TPA: hypothetical protein VHY22_17985 [Chthoniobacteraceae bacterium]|nr:hypothetical protein [Chthoniobacteraceae bacterium]
MHLALRSSLVALLAVAVMTGCETHDRRIYSTRQDKNLHTPDPWAPSTSKAADEATSSLDGAPGPSGAPELPAATEVPPPSPQ